jgi:hypothetical protein
MIANNELPWIFYCNMRFYHYAPTNRGAKQTKQETFESIKRKGRFKKTTAYHIPGSTLYKASTGLIPGILKR